MVQHIVAWNYADGFSDAENRANAQMVKRELEALAKVINGVVELTVHIGLLSSGNRDIVLYSLFESVESLEAYQIHPEHQRVSAFVRTVTKDRVCVDYLV